MEDVCEPTQHGDTERSRRITKEEYINLLIPARVSQLPGFARYF